jgi:hypothetical protein
MCVCLYICVCRGCVCMTVRVWVDRCVCVWVVGVWVCVGAFVRGCVCARV